MNNKHKETRVRISIPTAKKVVLLETMVFLVTSSTEKILEILEYKIQTQSKHQEHFLAIQHYVKTAAIGITEINLESWCRANDQRLSWKHSLAEMLEKGYCEIYYRPLGIYVHQIEIESFHCEVKKPFSLHFEIFNSDSTEHSLKDSTGANGRRFYYKNDLILQVQDRFWT
ncbi:MAG TPA: hypothetical protein PL009_08175 [Flavipsychrobacter sp.]|nr:hypothetical protein [Flavipsychrobacter sp.]